MLAIATIGLPRHLRWTCMKRWIAAVAANSIIYYYSTHRRVAKRWMHSAQFQLSTFFGW